MTDRKNIAEPENLLDEIMNVIRRRLVVKADALAADGNTYLDDDITISLEPRQYTGQGMRLSECVAQNGAKRFCGIRG
jgi:hypothetical protein